MIRFCFSLFIFFSLAFASSVFAQATLSIQGVIKNSDGTAVDNGKYSLTFRLYETESGGTAVWSETQDNVQVTGGIYSALLGSSTPMTAAFNTTYYLGLSVEGGAELIPRAKLTSSPYALSLIGTGNIFPSSGTIGAGTVTPTAGYQIHAKSDAGDGKVLVEGSTAAQFQLKKGATSATVGFGAANNDFVVNPGANNTLLQYNGSTKLTVNTNGADVPGTMNIGTANVTTLSTTNFSPANMAITSKLAVGQGSVDANNAFKVNGTSYLAGFVEINGAASVNYGGAYYWSPISTYGDWFPPGNGNYSLRCSNMISAAAFVSNSDCRIKKDFHLSENSADLATLRKLRVTDYRHLDEVQYGTALKKGFVAQEVEQVFPEAITKSENFIPDVYAMSAQTQLAAAQLTISLEKKHDFAVGDEVKLMLPNGEKTAQVAVVPTENAFSIRWDAAAAPDKVFVYGKKIKDFRAVDYDRIFTLNVSATQALARKVEALEKENAALRAEAKASAEKMEALEKGNTALRAEVKASDEKMEARLRALESMMNEQR